MFSNNMAALSADKNGLAGHEMRLGIKRFRYSGAPECLPTEVASRTGHQKVGVYLSAFVGKHFYRSVKPYYTASLASHGALTCSLKR